MDVWQTLGADLKARRKKARKDRAPLAREVGTSDQTLRRIESGQTKPNAETWDAILLAYGVTPAWIAERLGDETPDLIWEAEPAPVVSLSRQGGVPKETLGQGSLTVSERDEIAQAGQLAAQAGALAMQQGELLADLAAILSRIGTA